MRLKAIAAAFLLACPTTSAHAQSNDFNAYILKAIAELYPKYKLGGYDMSKVYTHDIQYGANVIPKTSPKPAAAPSMCVAAMAEVIATALNIYQREHPLAHPLKPGESIPVDDVIDRIKVENFTRSSRLTLRGNIFMLADTGSLGTASTLARFGLGKELPFSELKAGDFVNLNRSNKTGHAVAFLGYLDKDGNDVATYGPSVKGFKYFSDQGHGKPDAGLGYRWAFFGPVCPALPSGKVRDCKVIFSTTHPALLNTGRMLDPHLWTYEKAVASLRETSSRSIAESQGISRAAADNIVDQDLPNIIPTKFDGSDGN